MTVSFVLRDIFSKGCVWCISPVYFPRGDVLTLVLVVSAGGMVGEGRWSAHLSLALPTET